MSLDRDSWAALAIGVLGVWRVTHLVTAEDGPWDVVARLRRLAGQGMAGRLLDCFKCCSLWVALPWAWVLADRGTDRVMVWLAVSGGAILIERAFTPAASWSESPPGRNDDGVLR